ncbi:MAG: YdcF family protein [Rhodospirillaceae bacterium]|jgi:uncharacterized SAM-binding protein YcdF (DUF218 family)|nr:YdcF family protein [Rhodospirillaceae bacterium]MBT3491077.1 YdcF family protein [Rhodospirillaceae bacterium]MBT3975308.1 YdcF family protein [Rhodospirillaceae bacterium]MBT4167679.1 YdcF family protein [Rhodospirillaceae bacterium]MBT4562124.1 YdcF family protein [Rhodospirillaceae bacterium]
MFHSAAKIIWAIASPLNLTLLLLCLGSLLLWTRWRRFGVWLVSVLTLALMAIAILPIGAWVLAPLERQFPVYELAAEAPVTGIVLLSGAAVDLKTSRQVGHAVPGYAADRLVEFIRLARAYPKARLLICGGNAGVGGAREGPLIAEYLIGRGFPRRRFMVENASRDTHENAVLGRKLAQPKAGEQWLLVTSAWHMPRAVAAFRGQNWPVVAAPPMGAKGGSAKFTLRFELRSGLGQIRTALHEYLGLLAYRLNGRSQTLWPAP